MSPDGGAILIAVFVAFLVYIYTQSPFITIFAGSVIYIILGRTKILNKEVHQKEQRKYIQKQKLTKQIIYPYKGLPVTMTIPFFYHFYQLLRKHNIQYTPFWNHMDKVVTFWTNIRDETKKQNPHQIHCPIQKDLLHSCWTQNANHASIKQYLQMTEDYQWKQLPEHVKLMEQKDVHGAIEWDQIHKHIQEFYQKIGVQLMVGIGKEPCDCYQPPRFYGNNFDNFEQLEGQHHLKNRYG